ncbi:MAG: ABC transporter ATP-binding protein [Aquihabitans sp.]
MTAPSAPVLQVADLRVTYVGSSGEVDAVRNVSFDIAPGEVVGLVGESGSGKSSICTALLGLHDAATTVTSTTLTLDGRDLRGLDDSGWRSVRGTEVALIPQHPMTALSAITAVGRQLDWYLGPDAVTRYADQLRSIGLQVVVDRPGDLPGDFSGGQLQRLVIAIATFGSKPALLVADEPTSTLDATVQANVLEVLAEQRTRLGIAMLFVSHDLSVVAQVCDRVGVMHAGELVELAPVRDLFDRPQHPYSKALVAALPSLVAADTTDGSLPPTAIPNVEARAVETADEPHPLLSVRGLHHVYPRRLGRRGAVESEEVRAVDGVDLTVAEGSVTALVGESGSGKTTVARAIVGAFDVTAGEVHLDGRLLTEERSVADRRLIQLVSQNPRAALNRRRNLAHALDQAQRVHGIGGDRAFRAAASLAMFERVGLDARHLTRRPGSLSGGELARAVLARSLLLSPRLLILDEPTASLDTQVKAKVLDLLAELRSELSLTLLVITHELPTARAIADEVAVMRDGRIVEHGPTEQVFATPDHPYTQALLASIPADPRTPPS